jgi:hypothetical protein
MHTRPFLPTLAIIISLPVCLQYDPYNKYIRDFAPDDIMSLIADAPSSPTKSPPSDAERPEKEPLLLHQHADVLYGGCLLIIIIPNYPDSAGRCAVTDCGPLISANPRAYSAASIATLASLISPPLIDFA